MKARLLFLLAVAGALAIYFASAKSKPVTPVYEEDDFSDTVSPQERAEIKANQQTLDTFPLPGREPTEKPDLDVRVEVNTSGDKNRLYFDISERHGYYVEQFRIRIWNKRDGSRTAEESALALEQFFDRFLKANETLRLCMEVVPAELSEIGGSLGAPGDWAAEIAWHGRARRENPNPLPPDHSIVRCD